MNILFLTRYPVEGASSRYRVYQYLPYLKKNGIEYKVSSLMDKEMYKLSTSSGNTFKKLCFTSVSILKRLTTLLSWKKYDVIYLQRELLPFGPPIIEKLLKNRGACLVFDYDDALFIHKNSEYNEIANFFRSANKTIETFKIVDCVMAGNNYLRDKAAAYCNNSITFEVAEDTLRIQQRATNNRDTIIIGWLGSQSTVKYLKTIQTALIEIHKKYPNVGFHVMGGDSSFSIPGLPIRHLEWSLDNELHALESFDIGLMPLPKEEWSKGKSGGKARTYMAAGVVPVCTNIGYNLELIQHGVTGFLCTEKDEWVETLSNLIENASLRQSVGNEARAYVVQHFDVDNQAKKMTKILQSLVQEKKAKKIDTNTPTPAFVLGRSATGLYAIRELGQQGIPVCSEGIGSHTASWSKYLTHKPRTLEAKNDKERVKSLLASTRNSTNDKAFIVASSDQDVAFLCRYAEQLSGKFHLPSSIMTGLANDIMNKDTLYHLCDSHGVAAPKCWTKGADELMALEDELYFPCLIKPSKIHVVKTKMGGRKLWVIKNTTEYRAVVNSLPVGDTDWIVQEIIPGPESEIWLYTAYFDRESRPHQAFTARKTRQYPPGFGSASLVYSEENVELKSLCEDFFKKVSYEGIAAAELKRDPTDGILKMIEINPRPSLWFSLSTAAGKKITLAAYLNAQKQPPLAERAQLDGIQWRYWLKDMYSKIFYLLNPSFVLPPPEIKQHSTNTTRINAVYDPNDLLPLFGELQSVMRKALLRMIKKVASL